MKLYVSISILLLSGLIVALPADAAPVFPLDGTKHDLSAAGPGPYKAISGDPTQGGTTEKCIFCHTPHSGNTEAPLWNRPSSNATYETYTSDVLGGLGYYGAEDPKTGVPHAKTRICLSCHDGTIALGSVVNMPNDIPTAYTQIQMAGSSAIQPSSAGYIGIKLQDDHPVAIKHDRVRDLELVTGSSVAGGVRLYKDSGSGKAMVENADGNYVECTSCHDVHSNVYGNFLVSPNVGSALCKQCHTKTGFEPNSIHVTATALYSPQDGHGGPGLSTNTQVGGVQCMNCHFPHKAGITDTGSLPGANPNLTTNPKAGYYLLSFQEEMSCFNNTNRWGDPVTICHGTSAPAARNIQSVENNNASSGRRHWTQDPGTVGRHEATEGRSDVPGWLNNLANWHVECSDCHNSHTAGGTNHTSPVDPLVQLTSTSPLYGTGGVSLPGTPRAWGPPGNLGGGIPGSGYTSREPLGTVNVANSSVWYEYEICFKCHTDFAWGTGSVPNSPSLGQAMTDQAMELSTGNASYHPVVGANTVNNQGAYVGGWNAGNTQTMYCSDCHTAENGNRPLGPHGSANAFILKRPFTDTYMTPANLGNTQPSGDICFDCHDSGTYLNGVGAVTGFSTGATNLHTRHYILSTSSATGQFAYRCVNCHSRIPHGYTRKAMVVQANEGAPYVSGGAAQGKITVANLPLVSGTYNPLKTTPDCTTVAGCHQ